MCVCHVYRCQSGRETQRDPTVSRSRVARARVRFLREEKAAVPTARSDLAAPWDTETVNHFREGWNAGLVPLSSDSIRSHLHSGVFLSGSMTRGRHFLMFVFLLLSRYLRFPEQNRCASARNALDWSERRRRSETAANGEYRETPWFTQENGFPVCRPFSWIVGWNAAHIALRRQLTPDSSIISNLYLGSRALRY